MDIEPGETIDRSPAPAKEAPTPSVAGVSVTTVSYGVFVNPQVQSETEELELVDDPNQISLFDDAYVDLAGDSFGQRSEEINELGTSSEVSESPEMKVSEAAASSENMNNEAGVSANIESSLSIEVVGESRQEGLAKDIDLAVDADKMHPSFDHAISVEDEVLNLSEISQIANSLTLEEEVLELSSERESQEIPQGNRDFNPGADSADGLEDVELKKDLAQIPDKMAFKIGEVADLLGVKQYVLRYWETEFEALKPKKSAHNQRMYSRKDVETGFLIKKLLYRDRFSIEGARKALKTLKKKVKEDKNWDTVVQRYDGARGQIQNLIDEIQRVRRLFS